MRVLLLLALGLGSALPFTSSYSDCTLVLRLYLTQRRGVSHRGLAICIKMYLKEKEELWKLQYFTMQKYHLQKKSSKTNQNPSRYYNSITNLKFQYNPKYHLSKFLI
jgi:hypothetical protein